MNCEHKMRIFIYVITPSRIWKPFDAHLLTQTNHNYIAFCWFFCCVLFLSHMPYSFWFINTTYTTMLYMRFKDILNKNNKSYLSSTIEQYIKQSAYAGLNAHRWLVGARVKSMASNDVKQSSNAYRAEKMPGESSLIKLSKHC